MADQPNQSPVDMFNELVKAGHIQPASDYANLSMPTIYRSVPYVTTCGTVAVTNRGQGVDAKLERGPSRDR